MRFSQAALSPRRMKSHIQKNCSLSASQLPIRLQSVFSAIKISFCVPPTHRIHLHLCMSPDSAIIALLTFPQGLSFHLTPRSGLPSKTPSLQWRDRAGISPASILASKPPGTNTGKFRRTQNLIFNSIHFSTIAP